VIDSSDYQQKINGLLQDENTNTKISDRCRNPTPSTEKSQNALLKQIKGQTSAHEPGVQQLDDTGFVQVMENLESHGIL